MMTLNDLYIRDAHRRELLRRAERERLLAQALPATRLYVYRPVVSWTGKRLVALGNRMLLLSQKWEYRENTVYNGAS